MQIRNGIAIVQMPKKMKRRVPPNFKLESVTMIKGKEGTIRLPNFEPVLKLMREKGWKWTNINY